MTRVLVAVGTDTHPFDRLVRWIDAAARRHSERVEWFVQYGYSAAPSVVDGTAFLDHDEMQKLLEDSDLLICHGGPSTIREARRQGRRPLVVPRSKRLGEHVDDHQRLFVRRLDTADLVWSAETAGDFERLVDSLVTEPEQARLNDSDNASCESSVQRFSDLVASLFS